LDDSFSSPQNLSPILFPIWELDREKGVFQIYFTHPKL